MAEDSPATPSFADDLLDELLPEALDWRHLVHTYPRACMVAAAAAGFFFGRRHGGLLLAAVGSYVAAEVGESVAEILGGD
jgi:hypothetical protein